MPKDQQSSIDRLPDDIREQLNAMLQDPRLTQVAVKEKINAILEADGHPELSYSAINRYKVRMDKIGARIRQSREVARMWVGKLGAEPQGEVGKLLNEMVRNLAFEATTEMLDGEAPIEPKMLKDLAIAIERLERASSENVKRDEQVRKQALEQAAAIAGSSVKKGGLTEAVADEIRRKILGIEKP